MTYQSELTFDKRCAESSRIIKKFPHLIPVICERNETDNKLPALDRRKFLVPPSLTLGQFIYVVRKRIVLEPSIAMYMFLSNNTLAPTCSLISALYNEYKNDDGFMYISYTGENTFG